MGRKTFFSNKIFITLRWECYISSALRVIQNNVQINFNWYVFFHSIRSPFSPLTKNTTFFYQFVYNFKWASSYRLLLQKTTQRGIKYKQVTSELGKCYFHISREYTASLLGLQPQHQHDRFEHNIQQ